MKLWILIGLGLFITTSRAQAQALSFNGKSDYVKIPNNSTVQLRNFTLEAWIYIAGPGATTGTSRVGGKGLDMGSVVPLITRGRNGKDSVSSALNYFFGYRLSDRRLVADFEDNTLFMEHHRFFGRASLPLATWTHVAVTYNTAGVWKSYINGKLDATKTIGLPFTPQHLSKLHVALGSAINSYGIAEGFFNGKMDEVRFWNVDRTSTQIAASFDKEISSETGLTARYSFNEGTGDNTANKAAGGYAGALVNEPTWVSGYHFAANNQPGKPEYAGPQNGGSVNGGKTNLCVLVNDPDGNPLTVTYYARKKASNKKFTMVILPDPQYYVAEPQGRGYIKGAYNIMYKTQTRWIAANRAARNIVFVGGTGDCTDHGDSYIVEWKRADTAIRTLEDSTLTGLRHGIPYGLPVGNHDQAPRGDPKGATYYYNKFFGSSRYQGRDYYGGHYGNNNDNHYQLFSASGIDFLVLCPEWDMTSGFTAPGGVLDWMENLVKAHPNRKVIVLSHYLINLQASFTTQGRAIYNRLKYYPNFLLMSAGHIVNETTGAGEARRTDTLNGNLVHTITQDYQARQFGGNGLLRTYEFDPANNKIFVQTYSPYSKTFETDVNSQFTLSTNLNVTPPAFKQVGQQTGVKSGSSTCFTFEGLEEEGIYEWYATVSDGQSTTTGPVWTLTTNAATATGSTAPNDRIVETILEEEAAAEAANQITVKAFPNPNRTRQISISIENGMDAGTVEVFDFSGNLMTRKIMAKGSSAITFDHNLPNGMYKAVIRNREQSILGTTSFLVNR